MSSHEALLHLISIRGFRSIANPLLNPSMLCIQGTAAIVSGEIVCEGTSTRLNSTLLLYLMLFPNFTSKFLAIFAK